MKHLLYVLSISVLLVSCQMNNGNKSGDSDMAAKNAATVKNFYEKVFNAHNTDMIDSFVVANCTDHSPDPGQEPGRDGLKKDLKTFFTGFPDQHVTINVLTADSNTVAAEYTISGTNSGEFMGMPATNKKFSVEGMDMFKFDNTGKITDRWGYYQEKKFMQQMGVMPSDSDMMQMNNKMMDKKDMKKKK